MIRVSNVSAALFLLLALSFSPCAFAGDVYKLKAELAVDGDKVVVSYTNISDLPVKIGGISFDDSTNSGAWLFLYDVRRKDSQEAYALIYGGQKQVEPLTTLKAGQTKTRVFDREHILGYFMRVPSCFYLTTIYRKKWAGEIVASKPSTPVLICTAVRRNP